MYQLNLLYLKLIKIMHINIHNIYARRLSTASTAQSSLNLLLSEAIQLTARSRQNGSNPDFGIST